MLAKQLSILLVELVRGADMATDSYAEMEKRFEAMRAYNRLPMGRENRGRALSDRQIIATLFGLTTARPGWAGHAVAVLEKLKPVGGSMDAFGGAGTISDALCRILTDKTDRERVVSVRLSSAEAGTNSNGLAVITYVENDARKQQVFVRDGAVSLLQPGATYDSELRNAPISQELVFNRRFFDRLAHEVERARAYPTPPIGDGAEYDREDAENARRKRLGAKPSSRFLNIGVDNQVTWPREKTLITFDRYTMVLMPKTADHVQSVHIDLHANRLSDQEALTVINRFLSLLTWCDDQFAITQDGWSGNPIPVPVSKRNLAFTTASQWKFDRAIPDSAEIRRALALYREARNAEQNFMVSYAVLNYYKIIELRHPGSNTSVPWVAANLPAVLNDQRDRHGIDIFLAACGEETPELYIYAACRVAVAHSSPNRVSDPDEAGELQRLHNAADIMRRLARLFILKELGFPDGRWITEPEEAEAE